MKRIWLVLAAPLVVAAFSALLVVVLSTGSKVAGSGFNDSPIRPTPTRALPVASPFVSPLHTPTPISGFERPYYGPPTSPPPTPTSTSGPGGQVGIGSVSPQAYLPIVEYKPIAFTCEYE